MKLLERIFFVAGALLLAWLVYRLGVGNLVHDLGLVGWGFALVFLQEIVAVLFNTLGWRYALPRAHRRVRLVDLGGIRMAGDAVNYVTPSATIGGEFVKVRLLGRRIPTPAALSSVALSVLTQFFAQVFFVLAALPFLAANVLAGRLGGAVLVITGFGIAVLFIIGFLAWKPGRLLWFRRLLSRIRIVPIAWIPGEAAWRHVDEQVFGALRTRPVATLISVAFFWLGWFMGAVEIYLILWFLHSPVTPIQAFTIEALSILIDAVFFFVPAKLGTQEGGKSLIFVLLDMSAQTGLVLGVVRRLREIAFAFIGMAIFGLYQRGEPVARDLPGTAMASSSEPRS